MNTINIIAFIIFIINISFIDIFTNDFKNRCLLKRYKIIYSKLNNIGKLLFTIYLILTLVGFMSLYISFFVTGIYVICKLIIIKSFRYLGKFFIKRM